MLRKALGSFALGALSMSVLAVTPFGFALAQTPPPTCAQQIQACKGQVHNTRDACLPNCESSPNAETCDESLQTQFVEGINLCNTRLTQCIAGQPPSGSYSATCVSSSISVSTDGTLSATCLNGHGGSVNTQLPNAYACTGDIDNDLGTLRCLTPLCAM